MAEATRTEAADMLIEGAEDEGIEIDEDCVRDKAIAAQRRGR